MKHVSYAAALCLAPLWPAQATTAPADALPAP